LDLGRRKLKKSIFNANFGVKESKKSATAISPEANQPNQLALFTQELQKSKRVTSDGRPILAVPPTNLEWVTRSESEDGSQETENYSPHL
jgi:hypothetical protein